MNTITRRGVHTLCTRGVSAYGRTVAAIAFALAMAFTFTACTGDNGDNGGDEETSSSSSVMGGTDPSSSSVVATPSSSSVAGGTDPSSSSGGNTPSSSSGGTTPSSSGTGGGDNSGTFTDSRDNKTYKWVKIGEQTWMAENLNYSGDGSVGVCYGKDGYYYVYDDDIDDFNEIAFTDAEVQANCAKYGSLYDWVTAMNLDADCNRDECASQVHAKHKGICPTGWHIPSSSEWSQLYRAVDGDSENTDEHYESPTAGRHLKAKSGWDDYYDDDGNGTDEFGFSALPGGSYGGPGEFFGAGHNGYWWSASEDASSSAYYRRMHYYSEGADWYRESKYNLFSLRCVKD